MAWWALCSMDGSTSPTFLMRTHCGKRSVRWCEQEASDGWVTLLAWVAMRDDLELERTHLLSALTE